MDLAAIEAFLAQFELDEILRGHAREVLTALPHHILHDFTEDPAFLFADYDPTPGLVSHIPVRLGHRTPGRSVVLKRTLSTRSHAFARYVIAHELAHAHLRNAGRWPGDDPEHAADALAAEWGFPRPARWG